MKHLPLTCTCVAILHSAAGGLAYAQTPPPAADEPPGPVLSLHVQAGAERDSNILRAPDAVSDEIGVLSAGVRIDKRYSLQRLTPQAHANRYRFREFSNLDYSTYTYEGAWHFAFTPRLRGTVSARQSQLRDFSQVDAANPRVDLRTERRERAEVTLAGRGGWYTLAGVAHDRSRSDDPRSLEASPTVSSLLVGGGYEFPTGARLSAQLRRGEGDYGAVSAGIDFREVEPSLALRWPLTAKTSLDARVGYLDRSHDTQPARDFQGLVGSSALRWEFSPRTSVEAGLARDLGSYQFGAGGRIQGWRLFIAPAWKPSEKTTLRFRHAMEWRDWRVVSPSSPDLGREDRTTWNTLALEWVPRRFLELSASARHERRHSNLPGLDFRATVYSLSARLNF